MGAVPTSARAGWPGDRGLRRPRFVGRDHELELISTAFSRRPSLVLIEGEAGIGKSRLVREALAVVDD